MNKRKICIVTDSFEPDNSSAAVQLRCLADEFISQGYIVDIMVLGISKFNNRIIKDENLKIFYNIIPFKKPRKLLFRGIYEMIMPFFMICRVLLREKNNYIGVINYAPSIFNAIFASYLKKKSKCNLYLIVRDMFPEWLADLGLLDRKSYAYRFFKIISKIQYDTANKIGIQSAGNMIFINKQFQDKTEVLNNWYSPKDISERKFSELSEVDSSNFNFLYAGNVGVAQKLDFILSLARRMSDLEDVKFIIVGRGDNFKNLYDSACDSAIKNVVFVKEVNSNLIPSLYDRCNVGIVALDPKHNTNNIPGKFISYLWHKLPVFVVCNSGNEMKSFIQSNNLGFVCSSHDIEVLENGARELHKNAINLSNNCKDTAKKYFSTSLIVKQIIDGLYLNKD